MLIINRLDSHRSKLDDGDASVLGIESVREVEKFLSRRDGHRPTPLVALPRLADELGVAAIHVKDESHRLGLGSFKALGGSYAVVRLVLEEASKRLGRSLDVDDMHSDAVRSIARQLTVACATDGNHGRSVAQGAQLIGANCVIFVHAGVSEDRIAAIASFGADVITVDGNYDESIAEASRVAEKNGWMTVSDTSWPGYERIPSLVMQGYTALLSEAVRELAEPPTHVFVQAGVGGIAAAAAGFLSTFYGDERPFFTVVDPSKAACLFESARAGRPVKVPGGEPTIMAMLECYEPSLVAWRILSRVADAFMTVDDEEAIAVMKRLANPAGDDPAIVAGESGGVGLAGLIQVASSEDYRRLTGIGPDSRVFLINTEGATDAGLYERIVGAPAGEVADRNRRERAGSV